MLSLPRGLGLQAAHAYFLPLAEVTGADSWQDPQAGTWEELPALYTTQPSKT